MHVIALSSLCLLGIGDVFKFYQNHVCEDAYCVYGCIFGSLIRCCFLSFLLLFFWFINGLWNDLDMRRNIQAITISSSKHFLFRMYVSIISINQHQFSDNSYNLVTFENLHPSAMASYRVCLQFKGTLLVSGVCFYCYYWSAWNSRYNDV